MMMMMMMMLSILDDPFWKREVKLKVNADLYSASS